MGSLPNSVFSTIMSLYLNLRDKGTTMKKQLLTLVFMLIAGAASAQTAPAQPIATIVDTEGLVTIGLNDTMRNASDGMSLMEGANVIVSTTGGSTVDILFNSGCRVTLQPGQVFNVSDANCRSLVAARAGSSPVAGGGRSVGGGVFSNNVALMGSVALGLGIAVAGNRQSGS